MKRIIMLTLVIMLFITGQCLAADWSAYESGRNNIRLKGYQSQPGYIAFEDGDGVVLGYVWMSSGQGLVWCSATSGTSYIANDTDPYTGAINLEDTKLTNAYGVRISSAFTGTIAGHSY